MSGRGAYLCLAVVVARRPPRGCLWWWRLLGPRLRGRGGGVLRLLPLLGRLGRPGGLAGLTRLTRLAVARAWPLTGLRSMPRYPFIRIVPKVHTPPVGVVPSPMQPLTPR